MSSPLTLIRILEFLELVIIFLFPISLVTSITLAGILIYAGAACFALLLILNQKKSLNVYSFSEIDIAFLIYILAFVVSRFINSGIGTGFHTFFRMCQDYFVYLWVVFFLSKNPRNCRLIHRAILVSAFIAVIYGLLQFFHFDFFHRQVNVDRISGFHKNPYTYGGQLIVIFLFLLNEWYRRDKNLIWLFFASLCFFCVLNTSERAVIFGVIAGFILYLILQKIKNKDLVSCAFFLLTPVFLTVMFHRKVFKRIKNIVSPNLKNPPNIRFKLWGIALSIWKRNVLFGAGNFPVVSYQIANSFPVQYLRHAHNVYLQVLVTNGLIGLLSFINLFYVILKTAFYGLRSSKYACSLISVLLAFSIEGIFEYFWGDSEVRYLLLYFIGFVLGDLLELYKNPKEV